MIYDLNIPHEKEQAVTRFKYLLENKKKIDMTVKHPKRSISQNSYAHLLFSSFAMAFGYTEQETKQYIFKQIVNPEIFYDGDVGGIEKVQRWRSTADLDKGELTTAIERFLNYSAKNGHRLPEPSNLIWLEEIEKELSKHKNYL